MTGRQTTYAANGMVATPHHLASQAGLRVLQDGGNAVDAAIAANAVLNVVLPHQCHIGGDLFAMVWDPSQQSLAGLNSSGPAPAGATIEQVMAQGHESMPQRGPLSVTVPGTVAGWAALAGRYGTRELGTLFQTAVGYARDGIPVFPRLAAAMGTYESFLQRDAGTRSVFLGRGVLGTKDMLRQPQLAATFERVGREGPDGFYRGPVAGDIIRTLQSGGSAMSHDDLAGFEPEWVTPLRVSYRGYELVELPANSQGPAALLLANIAEGLPVSDLGHTTGAGIHAYAEATRRAFIERDRYLADPRFADVPVDRFVDKQYAESHRASIDSETTSDVSVVPGEDGDTAYLCAVDRDGLAISLIQSVYQGFGSGVLAPESGVLFQNRGASFTLDADHVNALQPGKRPRHTLIPAMLLKDGVLDTVFGAMGGDGQAQTHLQLLIGMIDYGLDPQSAIETPRWLVTTDADGEPLLVVEPAVGDETVADLRRRGHRVAVGERWDQKMGHAQMIAIDRDHSVLAGGADPRGDGIAAGW